MQLVAETTLLFQNNSSGLPKTSLAQDQAFNIQLLPAHTHAAFPANCHRDYSGEGTTIT